MNYQVLARKWRPKTFSDVVGQEYILTILKNSLSLGRIHHAYLFSGTRGVGKTSISRLLVKGLNCKTGITSVPCGICNNCNEIEQGKFIDLIEVDAASRTKVEDIRDLLDNVQYAPVQGRFKVYLIDEVHMLSRHSFNALLKTLEEPPLHVKFILATTDPQKLPITVLSRCLQFHLNALDVEQIQHHLEFVLTKEHIPYETMALQLLAREADGSLRDALSLTDQAIAIGNGKLSTRTVNIMLGALSKDQALSLIEALVEADGEKMMSLIEEISCHGIGWENLLIEIQSLLHRIAIIQLSSSVIEKETVIVEQRIRNLANIVDPTDIQLYYQVLLIGRKELPFAPNRRMGVEMTLLRALAFHPKIPLSESLENDENIFFPISPMSVKSIKDSLHSKVPSMKSSSISNTTNQILTARNQLHQTQGETKIKKNNQEKINKEESTNNFIHKHLLSIKDRKKSQFTPKTLQSKEMIKEESLHLKKNDVLQEIEERAFMLKPTEKNLKYEKKIKMQSQLTNEIINCDLRSEKIEKLKLSKENNLYIPLQSDNKQYYYHSIDTKNLKETLTKLKESQIELTLSKESSTTTQITSKWQQTICEEKLVKARNAIISDSNIHALQCLFDAELDKESICPI